jgi:hypothetical protein
VSEKKRFKSAESKAIIFGFTANKEIVFLRKKLFLLARHKF